MVVFLWWCLCGGVFVVVFLWWCLCGGVCVVVFESSQHIVRVIRAKVQSNQVVTNHSIGTCSVDLYILYLLKLPAPPRAVLLVYRVSIEWSHIECSHRVVTHTLHFVFIFTLFGVSCRDNFIFFINFYHQQPLEVQK